MKNMIIEISGNKAIISAPYNKDLLKDMRRNYREATWCPKTKTWTMDLDQHYTNRSLIVTYEQQGAKIIQK